MAEYFTRMEWTRVTSINRYIMRKHNNGRAYPDANVKGKRGLLLFDSSHQLLADYDVRVPESYKEGDIEFISSHFVEKLAWETTKGKLIIKRIDIGPDCPEKPNGQPLNWRATYCGRGKDNLLLLALLRVSPQINPLRHLELRLAENGTPQQVADWIDQLRTSVLRGDRKPLMVLPDNIQQELGLIEHKHLVRAFQPPAAMQVAQAQPQYAAAR